MAGIRAEFISARRPSQGPITEIWLAILYPWRHQTRNPVASLLDTIYLHAGLPKTGSSFIQDGMHALSQAGLLARVGYPLATPELGTGNGTAIARELIFTNPAQTTTERLQACIQDILQANDSAASDLLISSEDLCYADVEKFTRLKQVLLGHAKSVKLVVAIRPLKAWSHSVYLQLVKAHALAADYDATWLQAHTADFLFYFRNLDRFNVDTISFRYQENSLLRRFLGLIGENEDLASKVPDTLVNRSLSAEELSVVRAINGVFGDESLCRMVSDELVGHWPDRRGARFPAYREADFQRFSTDLVRQLDRFPGPVMDSVKEILFEDVQPPLPLEPPPDATAPDTLATAEVEIALCAIRSFFEARTDDVSSHRKLLDYAAGLERTESCFDPVHYLLMHPDVLRAGSDPWQHYRQHGRGEGRKSAYKPGGSSQVRPSNPGRRD